MAVLEPHEQDQWLDRAVDDQLSVADLRIELRGSQRGSKVALGDEVNTPDEVEADRGESDTPSMICPHCGKTIQLA